MKPDTETNARRISEFEWKRLLKQLVEPDNPGEKRTRLETVTSRNQAEPFGADQTSFLNSGM